MTQGPTTDPGDTSVDQGETDVIDWSVAERVACRAAPEDPYAGSYHWDSLAEDFAELTATAEAQVASATGLVSDSGAARARVVDRTDWVRANLASFQRLLRPITDKLGERVAASPFAPVARRVAGAEVGALLGWMSGRVLGQYDLLVIEDENPEDQDLVYFVGPNVLALEKRYGFPPREFRLWLALHEVTHRAQFTGIPWMREHFLGLVSETVEGVDPDPKRFLEAMSRITDDLRRGTNPLDEGGVALLFSTEEQRATYDRVGGLMSLLEGHGDVTMDRAGADQIPNAARFSQALRARRQNQHPAAKLVLKLVGMEAKLRQYEQGERFIEAVESEGGPELLDRAFETPEHLPTLGEIREPESWIARVRPAA